MTAATAEKQPERNVFMRTLEVTVTEGENAERKDRLVAVDRKIIATEAEKASEVSRRNEEIKQLRKERLKLLDAITQGKEKRDVEVYQEADERLGVMRIRRVDTDELVDERALTLEERQGKFPFEESREGMKEKTDEEQEADQASAAAEAGDASEGSGGGEPESETKPKASKASGAGKVVRIKASDAKKRKADRAAKEKAR